MICKNICKFSVLPKATFFSKRTNVSRVILLQQCPCKFSSNHQLRLLSSANIQNEAKQLADNIIIDTIPSNSRRIPKAFGVSSKSPEELLEKLIAGLSSDIHQKNRVYKNDLVRVINKVKDLNFSSKKQGLLLIRCCTELLPDEAPATRMALVELIWNTLKQHTTIEVEHYNELLRVYIANNRTLSVSSFIEKMKPVKPNVTTYELILRALGEAGDLNQATEVILNMKIQGLPATENVFNSLIICQGKAGNFKNIDEVLLMMKSLKLEPSVDTYTAVVRAKVLNKKNDEVLKGMVTAENNGYVFEERHVMEIVKTLAEAGMYEPVPQVLQFLPLETRNTPSISPYMQSVATLLVFQNHPMAALEIYKSLPLPAFGPKDDQGLHGRSLVRDCVKASVPANIIVLVTQELMGSGRNPIALQNASEAALQLGKFALALELFTRMQQSGLPLRPHYFWPILLHKAKSYGEKGVMNTLKTMIKMEVPPDYETILEYVLPNVNLSSPLNLMKKLMECGLKVSTALTPTMETLLKTGQIRAASEICEIFDGKVDAEKLMKPLVEGFLFKSDLKSTIFILEDVTKKAQDKNKDWVGRFLCTFVQHKKTKDLSDFQTILKGLRNTKLRISTTAADYCISILPDNQPAELKDTWKGILYEIADERIVDEAEMFTNNVPPQKHMNEQSLRAHLVELEAKGMNTRGVLRKLLQHYCRTGNLAEARAILVKCQTENLHLSAGMKASIFDLHVKLGELDLAEIVLADINKTSPNFTLDEFKIIDFATLMVYRNRIDKSIELIKEQSKKRNVKGGNAISMNCWRLLDATAAQGSPADVTEVFDVLHALGYCKPDNVIMGPLVRVHLKNNEIQEAVNEFCRIASKFNKTPLKHELICCILRAMGDGGKSEEEFILKEKMNGSMNKQVQAILNADKKVHGKGDIYLTLLAAFADVGYKKTLRKMLLDPNVKFHPDALMRRCERFADEKKVQALEAIAECARDIRHVDVVKICELILVVHQREDHCTEALSLWYRMQEANITPSHEFVQNICSLLNSNNQPVPPELSVLLDKHPKK